MHDLDLDAISSKSCFKGRLRETVRCTTGCSAQYKQFMQPDCTTALYRVNGLAITETALSNAIQEVELAEIRAIYPALYGTHDKLSNAAILTF